MHPIAVHATATVRAEQLQREAAVWRRSRSPLARPASRLPARLRPVRPVHRSVEVVR